MGLCHPAAIWQHPDLSAPLLLAQAVSSLTAEPHGTHGQQRGATSTSVSGQPLDCSPKIHLWIPTTGLLKDLSNIIPSWAAGTESWVVSGAVWHDAM